MYTRDYDAEKDVTEENPASNEEREDGAHTAETNSANKGDDADNAYNHLAVYVAADEFGVLALKSLARNRLMYLVITNIGGFHSVDNSQGHAIFSAH